MSTNQFTEDKYEESVSIIGYDLPATSEGRMVGGIGSSHTTSYWIMRKPCTKEEFEKAVEDGIRK